MTYAVIFDLLITLLKYRKAFRVTNTITHNDEALRPLPAGLMDRAQAAEFLTSNGYRTARATLAKLAVTGNGPAYQKFGRRPLYLAADLLQWAQDRCGPTVRSTSGAAGVRA